MRYYKRIKDNELIFIRVESKRNKYHITWYRFKGQYVIDHGEKIVYSLKDMSKNVVKILFN